LNKQNFLEKLEQLNLTIDSFSKQANITVKIIEQWDDNISVKIHDWLLDYEYKQKIKLLQKEFIEIKKTNKWFKSYHFAMYEFVMSKKNI